MKPWNEHLTDSLAEILIDEATLKQRVTQMAQQITADYSRIEDLDELLVVGILRGSVLFMSDLVRQIELPVTLDFMATSSYAKGTKSSGTVRIVKDLSDSITGKHVLIVEDIVDSGLTLQSLSELLISRRPASLRLCSLLDKPSRRKTDINADYCGFTIEDKFVVGYGLDFADHYRHLPYIGVLKPEIYEK